MPVTFHRPLNISYSSSVMRSSNMTFWRKDMRMIWLSRLPRLPGLALTSSSGVPHLTTTIMGTRCCFSAGDGRAGAVVVEARVDLGHVVPLGAAGRRAT